jgi:hypothetical protein
VSSRRRQGLFALHLVVLLALLGQAHAEQPPSSIEIISAGAHPTASVVVRRVLDEMLQGKHLEQRLQGAHLSIVVVPRRSRLTDVPQFASLKGRRTFDGRPWEDVRGTGGLELPDGRVAVAIPEENIAGGDDVYPAHSVAVHELAHMLHDHVLTSGDRAAVEKAYRKHLQSGEPFLDAYAGANVREYFAQGANAYFDRYAGNEQRDARWLWQNDRPLYTALARVFGAPRRAIDDDDGDAF